MKLNGTIILSLIDFKREFNFDNFWNVRKHFVRDMHPDKVYYWNEKDKERYYAVCKWIESESSESVEPYIRENGLQALSLLVDKEITQECYQKALGVTDYTQNIIIARNGNLKLPGKVLSSEEAIQYSKDTNQKERLHKIEVEDGDESSARIFIDGTEVYTLPFGECVYVTEIDGRFLRVLPIKLESGNIRAYLNNVPFEFESILHCVKIRMGIEIIDIPNITQFTIENGKIRYNSEYYYTL